jgi:hypothetical protein
MNMGIIIVLNGGGFCSVYYCRLLPHSHKCNPIQSCSDCHLVVCISRTRVMVVAHSHYLGTKVSHKLVLGWP